MLLHKYEFRTRVAFKNESANSQSAENLTALAAYRDGAQVRSDIPALLTVGAQVRPVEGLRLNFGLPPIFRQAGEVWRERRISQRTSQGGHQRISLWRRI